MLVFKIIAFVKDMPLAGPVTKGKKEENSKKIW